MSTYKTFLKGKHVLVVGLGPDGELAPDVVFLLKMGVQVTVADMRSESRIEPAVQKIQAAGMAQFYFGNMGRELIEGKDLILKSPDVPYDVPCIEEALDRGIAVETPSTFLLKLAPPITLIGVLGLCGKSTVAHFIHNSLDEIFDDEQSFWYTDAKPSQGILSILKKVKKGDVVLASITDAEYRAFKLAHMSPHVAVITTPLSDHTILEYQTYNNFLIGNDVTIDSLKSANVKAKMLRTGAGIIPARWDTTAFFAHIRENMALALRVAELFKVDLDTIQTKFEDFKGLKGRLEFVKKYSGIDYFNDTRSVRPYSTAHSLRTIGGANDTVLILGGVQHAEDLYDLGKAIETHVKKIILIPGSGTMQLHNLFPDSIYAKNIEEAVDLSRQYADRGGKVLFSPAFPPQTSTRDRGDQFVKAVKKL